MANFVEWDERYSIGIEKVDNQHKRLIDFTNRLYDGCKIGKIEAEEAFKNTIKEAVEYVKVHFSTEEELMLQYGYPYYDTHKKEHIEFTQRILADVKNYMDGRPFVPNSFVRFLKDWLLSHIAIVDKEMGKFLVSKGLK